MKNAMLAQVESLPELIRTEIGPLDLQVRELLNHDEILSTKNLVLTGCGDSYFASLAAEMAFASLANLSAQAVVPMKAARFGVIEALRNFPGNPLVLAISVSGAVARTVEALKIGRAAGAKTIGLTGDPASPLAQAAEKVLDCHIPSFADAPGVRTFRISLMALYLFAIRFGEVRGKLTQDQGKDLRLKLKRTADVIEQSLETLKKRTQSLAEQVASQKNFVFVGHGPNYGSALFSAAKVTEAAGRHACGQDTEEWAHLQYFITAEDRTPTFFISPGDQGRERLVELMEPVRRIGRLIVAVAPEEDTSLSKRVDCHLPIVGKLAWLFSPMVYPIAGELFAAQLADVVGEGYFGGSHPPYESGNNTIRSSRIMERDEVAWFNARQTDEQ